jgi:hypothetical protein
MFFPGSRYRNLTTYTVKTATGSAVAVTTLPTPKAASVLGFHPRTDAQRLDLIADHFLGDATTFWRLCDANGSLCPDALAARSSVAIPTRGP